MTGRVTRGNLDICPCLTNARGAIPGVNNVKRPRSACCHEVGNVGSGAMDPQVRSELLHQLTGASLNTIPHGCSRYVPRHTQFLTRSRVHAHGQLDMCTTLDPRHRRAALTNRATECTGITSCMYAPVWEISYSCSFLVASTELTRFASAHAPKTASKNRAHESLANSFTAERWISKTT
jgi:hypothetical protein